MTTTTWNTGRAAALRIIITTVLASLLTALLSLVGAGTSHAAAAAPFLATLGTNPNTAATEAAAGIKVGMVEIQWRSYETAPGVYDSNYKNLILGRVNAMRNAGMRITLSTGLHFTPTWILSQPNSRFTDEYGNLSNEADLVFNNKLRVYAQQYLTQINTWLPFNSLWAVRINSGAESELLYPAGGHYWASGPNAQNGPDMPTTMPRNPNPGWKPGTTGLTQTQVAAWETWYEAALADEARWQITTISRLGFTGYNQILTPGTGIYDRKISVQVAANLPDGTLGVGAVWSQIYADLADLPHIVAYVTSVGDGSGGNTGCNPTADDAEAINGPDTVWWGSARYIARIAYQYHMPVAGENPGYPTTPTAQTHYTDPTATGLMAIAVNLATTCNYQGLYWAHDDQLWNNTIPFTQLATYTTPTAPTPPNAT